MCYRAGDGACVAGRKIVAVSACVCACLCYDEPINPETGADDMTKQQAIEYTKQAEVWAACYQRGECSEWQARWAANRAKAAWEQVQA